jgi:hypothetical protein
MEKPNIIEAMNSPEFFQPAFKDLSTWANWMIFLKSLYGLPLNENELKIFQDCTGRDRPNPGGYKEIYSVCGRRGGKSRISALIAAYEAVLGGWDEKLSKGERGWIFAIATDKAQAKIILSYLKSMLEYFPGLVARTTEETVELKNQISISVKTCTFRASRGFSTVCVVCDECAFWRDENSANPAEEVINSILPGLVENGKLLGISTPYSKFGFLYNVYRDYYAKPDPDILIWKAPTLLMNPTYSMETINRLVKKDKTVFSAEYNAEFREDVTNFLPEELIRQAMVHDGFPYDKNYSYFGFLDPSGGRSDSFTLAISHRSGEKIIVDRIAEVRPPFNPDSVVKEFSGILKGYKIYMATADRYGGVWPSANFQKQGIFMQASKMDKNQIYIECQPLFSMGKIEIPNDERLCLQFQALERRVRAGGRDEISHPPGMHDDLANAVAGAAVLANSGAFLTEAQKEGRMPVLSEPSWRKMFRDPFAPDAREKESMEKEMQKWMGPCGIPDKKKYNPWES